MDKMYDYQSSTSNPSPQNEPRIENDYVGHPEIEQPDPSTATPSIPQEIPIR